MSNLDKLKKAILEGMNEVSFRECEGGITLTLSHRITSDNTVTLFIPEDVDMVAWWEHFNFNGVDSENPINQFHTV